MSRGDLLVVPLRLIALVILVLVLASPFLLFEEASREAADLRRLQSIAGHVSGYEDRNGRLPSLDTVRGWAESEELESVTLATSAVECRDGFEKPPADRFVVAFWGGERGECLSFPSGATTLKPTVRSLLASGLGIYIGILLFVGCAAAWAARRISRTKSMSRQP